MIRFAELRKQTRSLGSSPRPFYAKMEDKEIEYLKTFNQDDKSIEATKWLPRVVLHRQATEADVAKLENTLGISLPQDFRSVLLQRQGNIPEFKYENS